jgi:hypothetical protein
MDFQKNLLITANNQKNGVRCINLLKLIPKIKENKNKFRYKQPIFKTRNISLFDINSTLKKTNHNENEEKKKNDNITLINMEKLAKGPTKSIGTQMEDTLNINSIQTNFRNYNSDENNKILNNDRIYAYFNRDFYECEVPKSKKIEENQDILNYYIREKEQKEKYKRLNYEKLILKKNKILNKLNKKKYQPMLLKKYDIKNSLRLNDFSIYDKIHKVVRFWGKFANYACPIFQVQRFSLSNQKYNENKIKFSQDNLNKNDLSDKNLKLPILYTNSSNTINRSNIRKRLNLIKNKSDLDLSEVMYFNNKNISA